MSLLAREMAGAGHDVTVWCSQVPGAARSERVGNVDYVRLAPSRLLAPVVWTRLLEGGASAFDLVFEEVIGGERVPFLAAVLSGRPCVGMWYQDNRPLFAASYGTVGAALAGILQAQLLRLYRRRYLVTPSEATKRWLTANGCPVDRVVVHTPVVSPPSGAAPLPFEKRRNRVVSIGKFQPLKRFEEAIQVLERLSEHVPDSELILLGREDDGAYLQALRRRAQDSGVSSRVHFALNASESEKNDALRLAKALTIHSPREGFGWTVPEAGLHGVPVIANSGTPADVVLAGQNGLRLSFGDIPGYVGVLSRWMNDAEEWTGFSERSLRLALTHTRSSLPASVSEMLKKCAYGPTVRGRAAIAKDAPFVRR
jgi:glycosyltransferase involved in cell wall biosynthesis